MRSTERKGYLSPDRLQLEPRRNWRGSFCIIQSMEIIHNFAGLGYVLLSAFCGCALLVLVWAVVVYINDPRK